LYGERLRKSSIRVVLIGIWIWLMHYFFMIDGQIDIFRMWMLVGFPFGIYRVHVWLVPRNFDLGGTVGVWAMNILIGCLIGGFVVLSYILKLVYDMVIFMVKRT